MARRVLFTLPRSFAPADCLPIRLLTRADDARWLVSTILRKTAYRDVDRWGCVRLHTGVLRRIMYSPTQAAVVKALVAGGAIETAPHCAGIKAMGYRLTRQYLGDRSIQVAATDPRLIDRIDREHKRHADEQRSRWLPIHYALDQEQQAVTITDDAEGILDELPEHTRLCQHVLVSRIQRQELPFSVSRTGRCFNCVTGLKRNLRTAVRLAGVPMGSVDIRCAQPGLLAAMLRPEFPQNGVKKLSTYKHAPCPPPSLPSAALAMLPSSDADVFSVLASSGTLYEALMAASGLDRDSVKLGFLRDCLAKRGRYPSVVEDAFRAEFPTVHRIIREINRLDHGDLIRMLQRAESWLVISQVAPRLVERLPIVTLHDAVYSAVHDLGHVEAVFQETLANMGWRLSLKMECRPDERNSSTCNQVETAHSSGRMLRAVNSLPAIA